VRLSDLLLEESEVRERVGLPPRLATPELTGVAVVVADADPRRLPVLQR